jgi:hypothetical protein
MQGSSKLHGLHTSLAGVISVYMQGSSKLHGLHTSLAGVISVYVLKRAQQTRRAELRWCDTVYRDAALY